MIFPLKLPGGKQALLDFEDFKRFRIYSWYIDGAGYVARDDGDRKGILLHREVMNVPPGDPRVVDHKNHNRLDCQRENLRVVAGRAENNQNMPARGGSSNHRGVSWRKDKEKWEAQAKLRGKRIHIGYFDDEEIAAKAISEWRKQNMEYAVEEKI